MEPGAGGGRRGPPVGKGAAEVGKEASGVGFFVSIRGHWDRGPGEGGGAAGRGPGVATWGGRDRDSRRCGDGCGGSAAVRCCLLGEGRRCPSRVGGGGGEMQIVAGS